MSYCAGRFANATRATFEARFLDHLGWLLAQPNPEAVCLSRAAGASYANLLDVEAAYTALAKAIREGMFA